jgi:hypothetical protein
MNNRSLKIWADYIRTSVPYIENKRMTAESVIEVYNKLNPRNPLSERQQNNFLRKCDA